MTKQNTQRFFTMIAMIDATASFLLQEKEAATADKAEATGSPKWLAFWHHNEVNLLGQEEKLKARLTELEAKLEAKKHKGLGIQVWIGCFAFWFLFNIFLPLYFHLAEVVTLPSEFQAAEAEKAAEVQKALEAQTAAEAQLAAAGGHAGHAGQCPWRLDRFWRWQSLNSALPQALRQQLPVKYRKHLWLSWTYLN